MQGEILQQMLAWAASRGPKHFIREAIELRCSASKRWEDRSRRMPGTVICRTRFQLVLHQGILLSCHKLLVDRWSILIVHMVERELLQSILQIHTSTRNSFSKISWKSTGARPQSSLSTYWPTTIVISNSAIKLTALCPRHKSQQSTKYR